MSTIIPDPVNRYPYLKCIVMADAISLVDGEWFLDEQRAPGALQECELRFNDKGNTIARAVFINGPATFTYEGPIKVVVVPR